MMESLRQIVKKPWLFYESADAFYAGEISRIKIKEVHNRILTYEVSAKIKTRFSEETLRLVINEYGAIIHHKCSCHDYKRDGYCIHLISVAKAINEINPETFPIDIDYQKYQEEVRAEQERKFRLHQIDLSTDEIFKHLDKIQNNYLERELSANEGKIRFNIGYCESFGNQVSYELSIGINRLYKVKSISELVDGFHQRKVQKYGKSTLICLNEEDLDEPSKKIYKYIETYAKMCEWERYFSLDCICLDDFFDLLDQLPKTHTTITTLTEDYKLSLNMKQDDDCVTLYPDGLEWESLGNKNIYTLRSNGRIVRKQMDPKGFLAGFLQYFQYNPKVVISNNQFKTFYQASIEPYLDYLEIHADFDLDSYVSDISNIQIYSDMEGNNVYIWGEYEEGSKKHVLFDGSTSNEILHLENIITFYTKTIEKNKAVFKGRGQSLYQFLDRGLPVLMNEAKVFVSDELIQLKNRKSASYTIGVRMSNDLLHMEIDSDLDREDLLHALTAYRRKKKFYRLKNGDILDLEDGSLKELDEFATRMNLSNKELKSEDITRPGYQALHLDVVDSELDVRNQENIDEYIESISKPKTDIELDSDLLRDYQKDGVQWLYHLKEMNLNGILADDMGLGKTLQVLIFLEKFVDRKRPSLVVCPSSLMYNWMSEIEKFHIQLDSVCVTGNQKVREEIIAQKHDLYITTYDYLKRDVAYYTKTKFEYIILDEAQYIKNPRTQNAQSVKSLKSNHRLALTGTPIENSLTELWSIFDFLLPGYLYTLSYFEKYYDTPIRVGRDEETQNRLKSLVSPFILRRTKKEVLKDLPDKVEKEMWIDFNDEEKNLYMANVLKINTELQAQMDLEQMDSFLVIQMLTRLRQICCEPRMLYENISTMSSKLAVCIDLIETLKANDKKVLLFSSFTKIFDWLEEEFNKRDIKYHKITGAVDKTKRKKEVDAFQTDDSNVFLISLKAGGTGLNLTQAQAVIHFDPWWNVSAQNQATDRAYRIGQTKNVLVYQLLMKNSVEEKIFELQKHKKELSDMFVENSTGGIASLSKDELKDLFSIE